MEGACIDDTILTHPWSLLGTDLESKMLCVCVPFESLRNGCEEATLMFFMMRCLLVLVRRQGVLEPQLITSSGGVTVSISVVKSP